MSNERICSTSGSKFTVTSQDLEFYKKMNLTPPTLSPDERRRKRMAWATFRTLHRRKCNATGESILSMYAQDAKHPVYHSNYWWSDEWDALSYGQDFDFNKTFFEQFDELLRKVPAMHQSVIHSENCEYINMAGHCRNCYLSFYLDYCEDSYYLQDANSCKTCMDCLGINKSELCYECVDCENCYELLFSKRCVNCSDSYFLTECRGCNHCIGCFNLTNKNYYIFNQKASPKDFEKLKKQLANRDKIQEIHNYVTRRSMDYPKKYYFGHSNEGFSGDHIHNVRNSFHCFHCYELENVKYADYVFNVHNSLDVTIYGYKSEWLYNCLKTGDQCSNNICCLCCWTGSSDNYYCHLVISTKNCFGCSGLRHKQYCILNKSYTRHDYETLKTKIIGHMKETGEWGEFFPIEMSPFAYNESIANDYYPLNKKEALKHGYKWRNEENSSVDSVEAQSVSNVTDEVVDDSILGKLLKCESTGKAFKIVKPELDFYRRTQLPAPQICPEERHARRLSARNPRNLWKSSCAECAVEFETSFALERSEKVLCEKCYYKVLD